MVVLEEGAGVPGAHTPSDWLESEEFEPMKSDPIFMSADKFTKTPPPGTLSRVGCQLNGKKKTQNRLISFLFFFFQTVDDLTFQRQLGR